MVFLLTLFVFILLIMILQYIRKSESFQQQSITLSTKGEPGTYSTFAAAIAAAKSQQMKLIRVLPGTYIHPGSTVLTIDIPDLTIEGVPDSSGLPKLYFSTKTTALTRVSADTDPDLWNRLRVKGILYKFTVPTGTITANAKKGFQNSNPFADIDVFVGSQQLTQSRWPATEYVKMTSVVRQQVVATVTSAPSSTAPSTNPVDVGGIIRIDQTPPTWSDISTIWIEGAKSEDWAWMSNKVKAIDPVQKTVELAFLEPYPLKTLRYPNQLFRNIWEEMLPGNYFANSTTNTVYICLSQELSPSDEVRYTVRIPTWNHINITGSNVEIRNLHILQGRNVGISGNSISLKNCVIEQFGRQACSIGTYSTCSGCIIRNIGQGGISTSSNSRITNCNIYNIGQYIPCYSPCINVFGSNVRIDHNTFHDFPHNAVGFGGNNNIIEYNIAYNGLKEFVDLGVFYTFSEKIPLNSRGNILRRNVIHNILTDKESIYGVYLDGFTSGVEVVENIVYRFMNPTNATKTAKIIAFFINGGNMNTIAGNYVIDCPGGLVRYAIDFFKTKVQTQEVPIYNQLICNSSTPLQYNLDAFTCPITLEQVYQPTTGPTANRIENNTVYQSSIPNTDIQVGGPNKLTIQSIRFSMENEYTCTFDEERVGAELCSEFKQYLPELVGNSCFSQQEPVVLLSSPSPAKAPTTALAPVMTATNLAPAMAPTIAATNLAPAMAPTIAATNLAPAMAPTIAATNLAPVMAPTTFTNLAPLVSPKSFIAPTFSSGIISSTKSPTYSPIINVSYSNLSNVPKSQTDTSISQESIYKTQSSQPEDSYPDYQFVVQQLIDGIYFYFQSFLETIFG
jgi:hypothetical protein